MKVVSTRQPDKSFDNHCRNKSRADSLLERIILINNINITIRSSSEQQFWMVTLLGGEIKKLESLPETFSM